MGRQIGFGLLFALTGLLPAVFLVLVTIFSDPGAPWEYLLAFGVIACAYGLLGLLAGYVMSGWRAGIWLSAPAVAIVVLFSISERAHLLLHATLLVITLGTACVGAYGGAAWRAKREAGA
jgi:hypothetical protein